VIVNKDNCGRIVEKPTSDDFPCVDCGTVYGAVEQFLECQYPVAVIEKQTTKDLLLTITESGMQIHLHVLRRRKRNTTP
jgi:hypothetical protein